jgi:hypothetical protein
MNKKETFLIIATVPQFNRKIVERGQIDILSNQIHNLPALVTGTSIKLDGVKRVRSSVILL